MDEIIGSGVDIIRVSLQGIDAKSYEEICGVKINFDDFLNNLDYLYKHKGKCQIRMKLADVAIKNVVNGRERFEELFGDISDTLFVETVLPLFKQIDYAKVDEEIAGKILFGREGVETTEIHKVCHRPFYRIRIGADGQVSSACCDTPNDIIYGNINEESLVDIWNGNKRNEFLKMQLAGKRFMHPSCRECVAANDITTQDDYLDPWAEEILERMNKR